MITPWPQLTAAAAFVTAVAVVLNPITPALPDITVPALFPPDTGHRLAPKAVPPQPAASMPVAAAPSPPAIAATRPAPPVAWQPAAPVAAPPPSASVVVPIPREPVLEMPSMPTQLPVISPGIPISQVADGMAHAGDRPGTTVSRRPFAAPVVGQRPLAAAAVDSAGPPANAGTDGGGAARPQHGRGGSPRSDPGEPARGHRGPVDSE